MPQLDEIAIKSKLIDYILQDHDSLSDDVLALEVPFADFQRRADLVRINGCIHGYEIKSDLDNLSTLVAQIKHYQKVFDKVSIVTTKAHINKVRQIVPNSVGIIYINEDNIKVTRKAKPLKRADKYFVSCFFDRNTIVKFLKDKDIHPKFIIDKDIFQLRTKLTSIYQTKELKEEALKILKRKYNANYTYFLKYRGQITDIEHVRELAKGSGIIH